MSAGHPIRLTIRSVDFRVEDMRLRIPFRFGIATLVDVPVLTMRLVAEDAGGRRATGYSRDVLPALWFDKDPGKTIDRKVEDQITSAQLAVMEYLERGARPSVPFELWWAAYQGVKEAARGRGINPLTAGFGSSFPERAMIDAACRIAGTSFFDALKSNLFGIDPGAVHPGLAGFDAAAALPARPLDSIGCRHTVGLGDHLRREEVAPPDRLNDGLPENLEDDIAAYGLRYFKIKIDADRDRNLCRLRAMAEVFAQSIPGGVKATLDANEQCERLEDVIWLLHELRRTEAGRRLADSILFVEQPLHRDRAMRPDVAPALRELSRTSPVIIDESDNDVLSLVEARAVGYSGISCKNCKGVFKAVLNKCLIEKWRADDPSSDLILSSEDLTNAGVIPLQQDCATAAALGIDHSERNGHHYFRGLAHLTGAEQASALAEHGDLYERKAGGLAALRIKDGRIALGSLQRPGYGYSSLVEYERRPTLDAWRANRPREAQS